MMRLEAEERLAAISNMNIAFAGNEKARRQIARQAQWPEERTRIVAPSTTLLASMGLKLETTKSHV